MAHTRAKAQAVIAARSILRIVLTIFIVSPNSSSSSSAYLQMPHGRAFFIVRCGYLLYSLPRSFNPAFLAI